MNKKTPQSAQNLEKPLRARQEVSQSAFAYLFSEITQQLMKNDEHDIEQELHDLGVPIGQRVLELSVYREKAMTQQNNICQYGRRECKSVNLLHYINNQIWKLLFGRSADGIEQSVDDENEYRIIDQNPITNTFVNLGQDESKKSSSGIDQNFGPNCANFLAGIIEGILNSSKMTCKCSAHFVPEEFETDGFEDPSSQKQVKLQTLYVIKFDSEVTRRDSQSEV